MPGYFIHDASPHFIWLVNLKVMSRTLHSVIPETFPMVLDKNTYNSPPAIIDCLRDITCYPVFLAVRDPYRRCLSGFLQKCQKNPRQNIEAKEPPVPEGCQQLILRLLNYVPREPREAYELLLGVTAEMFASILPQLARLDDHFKPQIVATELPAPPMLARELVEERIVEYAVAQISKMPHGKAAALAVLGRARTLANLGHKRSRLTPTLIVRLESIQTDWERVCERLNCDIPLRHFNMAGTGADSRAYFSDKAHIPHP